MDSKRWYQIEQLYHAALEQEQGRREAFLAEACGEDEDLRREVAHLLVQNSSTGALIDRTAWQAEASAEGPHSVLQPGTNLGPYAIVGPLGEGGMGRVYRGRDTRLDRPVAIKISAERFSTRSEREARAISALNHPHICTLYDVGPNYLVMELVEGESLAQRIQRSGALPLASVLDIGCQVAEAMQAAHQKGIVHRDLKPANIRITPEGTVKVLDFGLAKTLGREVSQAEVSELTTRTGIDTLAGDIVGTPAYMSPEQARGKDVDAQTDIWAFGCLLYEFLTAKRAFHGESLSDTIAAVLEREPDWRALPRATPRSVRDLLRQCLQKEASRRPADFHFVQKMLRKGMAPRLTRGRMLAAGSVLAALSVTAWLLVGSWPQAEEPFLRPVPLTSYLGTQDWPSFSPDGSQVAFAWDGEKQDNFDIYVKRIGPGPPLRLTHDPAIDNNPVWAPDGNSIAFVRSSGPGQRSIMVVPPLGGPERLLAEVAPGVSPVAASLTWSPDSRWLAVSDHPPSQPPGLWLLSVETGERYRLTSVPAGALIDFAPAFAADGASLAFGRLSAGNSSDIYLLPLGEGLRPRGEPRRLTKESQVIGGLTWTADQRALVFSSGQPGNLSLFRMAIAGGARPKRLTGQGEVLNVAISARARRLVFAQSRREMDIYRVELAAGRDAASAPAPLIASSRLERYPRYSPDGNKIAFVSLRSGDWQLWVSDSDGANPVQLTSFGGCEVRSPCWSTDGRRIGFAANPEGVFQAYVIDTAGGKARQLEMVGTNVTNWSWSRDGRWIFFTSSRTGNQIWRLPAGGGVPEPITHHTDLGVAENIAESPDGKILYYVTADGVGSVPVNGGDEREVFRFDVDPVAIEVGPEGIFFVTGSNFTKDGDLMFYRFPSGPVTRVSGVQTRYGFSISPDRRWLAYTKMTATGSDLMLVEDFR